MSEDIVFGMLFVGFSSLIAIGLISMGVRDYFDVGKTKTYSRITFKSFVAFYNLKPGPWFLYNNYVEYHKYIPNRWKGYDDIEETRFGFSFPDLLKYRKWKKQRDKAEAARKDAEKIQAVLDDIKAEIEKHNKKNEEMMAGELTKITEIVNRMYKTTPVLDCVCGGSPEISFHEDFKALDKTVKIGCGRCGKTVVKKFHIGEYVDEKTVIALWNKEVGEHK